MLFEERLDVVGFWIAESLLEILRDLFWLESYRFQLEVKRQQASWKAFRGAGRDNNVWVVQKTSEEAVHISVGVPFPGDFIQTIENK